MGIEQLTYRDIFSGGYNKMTITYTSPFWFSLLIVMIIMFLINYFAQTFISKKKGEILTWGFFSVLLIQSLVITILFEFI